MISLVPWLCAISALVWLGVTSPNYDPDVTKWVEVERPAPDYEGLTWRVARHGNKVRAHLYGWREILKWLTSRAPFHPRVPDDGIPFVNYECIHVRDGWLIGFNMGEFGAALYWFSSDGFRNYKISDDQIVDFMATPQGIIAMQELYVGSSLIRLEQDAKTGRWKSTKLKRLQEEPQSFVRLDDGRMFLALSDSLALLTPDNHLETLVKPVHWNRADTIVTSADASKVYVGALQYVCEYDLRTKRFRYLVPDLSFVNKKEGGN